MLRHFVMKTAVQLHIFLTFGVYGREWFYSQPCRFTPKENVFGMDWPYRSVHCICHFYVFVSVSCACNIVFGTVCRDKRWRSWARRSLTSLCSASPPRASTRLWRRPLTTCWSVAATMQVKFASKYIGRDVNRAPFNALRTWCLWNWKGSP